MRNLICCFLMLFFVLIISGCHLFDERQEDTSIVMYFEQSQIGVTVGGIAVGVLKVEPPDGLRDQRRIDYFTFDPDIADVFASTRNSVQIVGRREGQTILVAKAGANEAMTVVNVTRFFID